MNDLEITKRIADIVGCEYEGNNLVLAYGNWIDPLLDTMRAKAWCFDLMVGYGVTFESCQFYKGMFTAFTYSEHGVKVLPKAHENSPNKAICLAIIAAHEDV